MADNPFATLSTAELADQCEASSEPGTAKGCGDCADSTRALLAEVAKRLRTREGTRMELARLRAGEIYIDEVRNPGESYVSACSRIARAMGTKRD